MALSVDVNLFVLGRVVPQLQMRTLARSPSFEGSAVEPIQNLSPEIVADHWLRGLDP